MIRGFWLLLIVRFLEVKETVFVIPTKKNPAPLPVRGFVESWRLCCLRVGSSRTVGRGNKYKDEKRSGHARRVGRCGGVGVRGGVALQHETEKNMRARECQAIGGKKIGRACNGCSGNEITAAGRCFESAFLSCSRPCASRRRLRQYAAVQGFRTRRTRSTAARRASARVDPHAGGRRISRQRIESGFGPSRCPHARPPSRFAQSRPGSRIHIEAAPKGLPAGGDTGGEC